MQYELQLTPLHMLMPWQRPRAAAVMSVPASDVDHRPESPQLQRTLRPTLLEQRIVCAAYATRVNCRAVDESDMRNAEEWLVATPGHRHRSQHPLSVSARRRASKGSRGDSWANLAFLPYEIA